MIPAARNDLAVTGLGCISGFGVGTAAFARGLFGGQRAYGPVRAFDTSAARSHTAGYIDSFDPTAFIPPARLRRIDRVGQLSIASCRLALEDARVCSAVRRSRGAISASRSAARRRACTHSSTIWIGSTIKDRRAPPRSISATPSATPPPVSAASNSACAASTSRSVRRRRRRARPSRMRRPCLRAGRQRAMITGGVDDFEQMFFLVYDRFRALASDDGSGEASRPFDRRRNGFILGCGAFLVVLESPGSALARGAETARPSCRLGLDLLAMPTCTHGRPIHPNSIRCMQEALAAADVGPRRRAVVFASANSSRAAGPRRGRRSRGRVRGVRGARRGGQGRDR